MKRFFVVLSVGVMVLTAVQWDVEQVTDEPASSSGGSLIALDSQADPHILFAQTDESHNLILKVATRQQDEWVQSEVADISQFMVVAYSLDVTPHDHNVVAYSGFVFEDDAELYLAADSSGSFQVTQLTDDAHSQDRPVVHVSENNMIHMVYRHMSSDFTIDELFYGWIDTSGFHSEQVTENLYTDISPSFDFILDNHDLLNIFYTADDGMQGLWQATRTFLSSLPSWSTQSTGVAGVWPSAAIDKDGFFHIACGDAYPTYVTDRSGTWIEETIIDSEDDGFPSLAVDPQATPHIAVWHSPYEGIFDVRYSGRSEGSWSTPQSLPPQDQDKYIGYGHYFAIDEQGYGHLTYTVEDTNSVGQVYYAKTTEPLTSGIAEEPAGIETVKLTVTGETILFSLPRASSVRLDLFDTAGRMVRPLVSGTYSAGQYEIKINANGLPAGVYFVRGELDGRPAGGKMVKLR